MSCGERAKNEIREYVYSGGGYFWLRNTNIPGLCGICSKKTAVLIQEDPKEPWKYACVPCVSVRRPVPFEMAVGLFFVTK